MLIVGVKYDKNIQHRKDLNKNSIRKVFIVIKTKRKTLKYNLSYLLSKNIKYQSTSNSENKYCR